MKIKDRYTIGEIRQIVSENEKSEFKAVVGKDVRGDDKKNSEEAVEKAEKNAKDYGGLNDKLEDERRPEYTKEGDPNKTTLDYNPESAGEDYKKRVEAQAKGYASTMEMENGIEKQGDYSGNERILKAFKDSNDSYIKNDTEFKKSGLQARMWPDSYFDEDTLYENKEIKGMRDMIEKLRDVARAEQCHLNETESHDKAVCKKTRFVSWEHAASRIPEAFKKDGKQFVMEDMDRNTYTAEWRNGVPVLISESHESDWEKSMEKAKQLYDYKIGQGNEKHRNLNEDTFGEYKQILDRMRTVIK